MATNDTTQLTISPRDVEGSRATRRLRREGKVPGVLYGGKGDPLPFTVDGRELRNALHASGAVIELSMDGKSTPAVLKDAQRHPVRGETTHVDFQRVDLSTPIQPVVLVELTGADDSVGLRDGGVLDQPLREVTVEALPNEIPESITGDVVEVNAGGAQRIEGHIVNVNQGGAMVIRGDQVKVEQGGALLIAGRKVEVRDGGAFIILARKTSGNVQAALDWRGIAVFFIGLIALKVIRGRR